MRIPRNLAAALLAITLPLAFAQTPITKPDLADPANTGRAQLTKYLDDIAAKQTAARRITIAAIQTRAQAEARQRAVRAKILTLIGGLPEKTPLNAKSMGTTQAEGFRIEKILFESQPNFPVTALLYLPDRPLGQGSRLPAIIVAPGHGPSGKASDFPFAALFARNGFAVLSYDPIGQGERLQYPDPAHPGQSIAARPTGEHGEAGLQPTLIGDSVARYFAWDGIRAVDYLLSRPEIDPARIGAYGCSGGGIMTALLGALDPRVAVIGTACFITSYDTLLPAIGPQHGEQSTPNFIAGGPQGKDNLPLDFPDWVELAAPRPYAIISTSSDMFPYAGALASTTEARRFYTLFDPASAGTPTSNSAPGIPSAPTLNPDTANTIPPPPNFNGSSAPEATATSVPSSFRSSPSSSPISPTPPLHPNSHPSAQAITPGHSLPPPPNWPCKSRPPARSSPATPPPKPSTPST